MTVNLSKRGATSERLGLTRVGGVINAYTTTISLSICIVAIMFIMNGINKVMECEVKATKLMKNKFIHDTVTVTKNVIVNDCDTIYMIDGVPMRKAN